jgi:hypothetical protein
MRMDLCGNTAARIVRRARTGEVLTSRNQSSLELCRLREGPTSSRARTDVDLHSSQGGTRENSDREWEVVTYESIILPPRSQAFTIGKVRKTRYQTILIDPQDLGK